MDEAMLRHMVRVLNDSDVKRIGYSNKANPDTLIIQMDTGEEVKIKMRFDHDLTWLEAEVSGYNEDFITWIGGD